MLILIIFSFLAGIVTILSPCILPILPIILSSTVDTSGKRRPLGIVVGFVLSFTFFTLFLSSIVKLSGIPAETFRYLSIIILIFFGLSLLISQVQLFIEQLFSGLTRFVPDGQTQHGFGGGLVIGLSLGLLWTPCVGPILASVISLALSGTVTAQAVVITLAYSLGTAIPMFIIMAGGQRFIPKSPWIQKAFGVVMILTAIGIFFNIDRKFQTFILEEFPNYGTNLTKFEDNVIVKKQMNNTAPEIVAGGEWFSSIPLTLHSLKGKVVLIDFWTYTCINCQRTLPYLRNWHAKYKDQGLVIFGVHSPEFEFEKNPKNVAQAIKDFKLTYPIVQDNDFATWRAYNNRYWPAKYLIDKQGIIRYTHFGEGAYDETEQKIQELLGAKINIDNPTYQNFGKTPETYLGSLRTNPFLKPDLIGDWEITDEYAQAPKDGQLLFNFEAQKVFLVMRPSDKPATIKVFVDGKALEDVFVDSDRLYTIVSLDSPGKHLLRLEFDTNHPQLFAFTFG